MYQEEKIKKRIEFLKGKQKTIDDFEKEQDDLDERKLKFSLEVYGEELNVVIIQGRLHQELEACRVTLCEMRGE